MTLREQLTAATGKGHLSYSSIKYALGDMQLWEMKMKGQAPYTSDALVFGTMYDMLLFERDKAFAEYKVIEEEDVLERCQSKTLLAKNPKLTSDYKTIKAQMAEEYKEKGQTITSSADWKTANDMVERLAVCGLLKKRLTGKYQVEFNEDIDGVPLRGFLDCLGDGFITDSKSSRSVDKFRYDINSFSYDIQAYIYTKVFNIKDYYWVVQEKTHPYYPAEIKCSEETLFKGEMKYHQALENIKVYLKNKEPELNCYASYVV